MPYKEEKTNVIAKMTGTMSMQRSVVFGDSPISLGSVIAAYKNAPMMPAPPVPEDQAAMLDLET